MKQRIKQAKISFLSLCPRGVNRLPVIYKAEGNEGQVSLDFDTLIKADAKFEENGELLAVVYAPELRDSQGEIASADVIKDMMYDSAKNGINVDMRHNNKALPKSDAYIAESFLVQKGDPRFTDMKDYHGAAVDVTGAWAVVLKIDNAELRKQYRSGEWNGISMGGHAYREIEKSAMADDVVARLAELLNPSLKKEPKNMALTKEEMTDIATTVAKAVVEAIKPAAVVTPVVKAEDKPKEKMAPIFKGSMGNPKDVRAHAAALKKFELEKSVDFTNTESVDAYLAEIALIDEETGKANGTIAKSEREIELEKELSEIRKASRQPAPNNNGISTATSEVKKEQDLMADGKKLGQMANAMRGYK